MKLKDFRLLNIILILYKNNMSIQSFLEENINIEHDNCPIIMIDRSGSTGNKTCKTTVLKRLFEVAKQQLEKINIEFSNIIIWDDNAEIIGTKIETKLLVSQYSNVVPRGMTDISVAFKILPEEWILHKSNVDIYILTDGDINRDNYHFDDQIIKLFNTYTDTKINLYILSVEPNNNDYKIIDYSAGNTLYRILRRQKLMHYVKYFMSYNELYVDVPYVNLYNQTVLEGYVPFKTLCFPITKTNQFIEYIGDIVDELNKKHDDDELLKLVHDLTLSLHHLTKNKPIHIINKIIDTFSNIFYDSDIYSEIKELLTSEISNHVKGMSTTFQDYRNNRERLFERAQECLNTNVVKSISSNLQHKYITYPVKINDNKYTIFSYNSKITESVKINTQEYMNAGIKIGDHIIPVFSSNNIGARYNNTTSIEFNNQCIRQWIRAIYSKIYNIAPSSDLILYLFLTNMLNIVLEDETNVPKNIKDSYVELALIMLDRKRFQSEGVKEIEHLLKGNPPLPVFDGFDMMPSILKTCAKMCDISVRPYTLWYGIIIALCNYNDYTLCKMQCKYCEDDLKNDLENKIALNDEQNNKKTDDDSLFVNEDDAEGDDVKDDENNHIIYNKIMQFIKSKKHMNITTIEIDGNNIDDYDFCDYISLEDTSITGGYRIPSHTLGKVICNPKYVIADGTYELLKEQSENNCMKCPICYSKIKLDQFEKVKPMNDYVEGSNKDIQIDIQETNFNTNLHEEITMDTLINKNTDEVYKIDQLNFNVPSYKFIDGIILANKLNKHVMSIRTSEQFINNVNTRFPFISKINMENICIAGGFCRSILLNQPVNDIDFYIIGINSQNELLVKLNEMIKNIIDVLHKEYSYAKFMLLYKQNSNVYEILCIDRDTKLQCVAELSTNYKIIHKIQIILNINKDIKNLFDKFDLYSSCVAFDGKDIYFNNKSYDAYKYMINLTDQANIKYTTVYNSRLLKYFENGFSLVIPSLNPSQIKSKINLEIDQCTFNINDIKNNVIIIDQFEVKHQNINDETDISKPMYDSISNDKNMTLEQIFTYIRLVNTNDNKDERIYYKILENIENINIYEYGNENENEKNIIPIFVDTVSKIIQNYDWLHDFEKNDNDSNSLVKEKHSTKRMSRKK